MIIELEGKKNNAIIVSLLDFPALIGWEMDREFMNFVASEDKDYCREFMFEVMKYAKVLKDGAEFPLTTAALIENQLETWQNIKLVFNAVLRHNGIDPEGHLKDSVMWKYWDKVGERVAISAMAHMGAIADAVVSEKLPD
ncbi:hypothetical protein [Burkholderia phage BCSR52]|jgi:hypothetical protein|uniref:Uncharacterized protein n=1 Tax=Burkholderia phage BCSR52 TaxID=2805748 RepID=A0A889IQ96_9CAUD|nr:hypothetical protein [Burkholderia phage BCSR52]DAP64209.1 MAG TPA: hypothetical protein [Caudoviricetes sp.]